MFKAAIITLSDKGAVGLRRDESGPAAAELLRQTGEYTIEEILLIPDEPEQLKAQLIRLCDEEKVELILTSGGTGLGPRDLTPEVTLAVGERNAPGFAEYMRARSCEVTPRGMLSRGVSVIRGRTLIINLPGSPKAVRENLGFILPALGHGLEILAGRGGECASETGAGRGEPADNKNRP